MRGDVAREPTLQGRRSGSGACQRGGGVRIRRAARRGAGRRDEIRAHAVEFGSRDRIRAAVEFDDLLELRFDVVDELLPFGFHEHLDPRLVLLLRRP